ncbi:peptide deformylase [Candidatus Parcubacteria bacterium]|uniref:Peptide deformylase n=1 Tax=Candidatus Kaiserbacteria bacterium CG10_big_fil_rev_8_21_14_0_10_47_16 TaxID=1974608 RepID=A0A2H0UD69_9BACT|nr:peptide deformylase [Candidatus Parcubacteria bacterium]PIR84373.1 MAG: peptide deformylase [Candidatus Kaiserbacteria bacterium CG10_big_fil_rev_8_21_14_0_10_47_16]
MAKLVDQDHVALHQIAEEVPLEDIESPKIKKVIKDMRDALLSYNAQGFVGVAIAAPQIGIPLRIFIVHDTSKDRDAEHTIPDIVAINPSIVKLSKKKSLLGEGCLSVPNHYGAVERAANATLRAYDEHGNEFERGAGGLLAQIFQHECDHLDGTLFIDRAEKIWSKDDMEDHEEREAAVE